MRIYKTKSIFQGFYRYGIQGWHRFSWNYGPDSRKTLVLKRYYILVTDIFCVQVQYFLRLIRPQFRNREYKLLQIEE